MDGWMDGQMDGWADGWMGRWMDGQMDRHLNTKIDPIGYKNIKMSSAAVLISINCNTT